MGDASRLQVEYVPVNSLVPFAGNPRRISPSGLAKLQRSVESFGFVNPILAQRGTNMIIAGHQRLKAAQAAGLSEVPVVWLDMDDVTAKAYNIADNRLQDEAEWDFTPLADLLTELDTGAFDLTLTGFDDDELERMMNYAPGDVQEDEVPEPPAESVTKPGDIWQLGKHRVMCGDSTKAEDVQRLMAGEQASLVITDPPYGVSYADKNAFLNACDEGNRIQTEMENDHAGKEATQKMWREAFANMGASMRPGAVVYCFMPQGGDQMMMMMMMMMMGAGIEPRHELIWVKNNHVLGRVDYAYKHEPIMYAWKPGGHKFYGDFQTSLLEFARPSKSDLHPTMKPIPLIARLMENSSLRDETVYDPFLGSGTTLIAAEQLRRTCYGMEIDPRYCDVIVKRWEQLTGKKAELVR